MLVNVEDSLIKKRGSLITYCGYRPNGMTDVNGGTRG
jgi:hypothetical protein